MATDNAVFLATVQGILADAETAEEILDVFLAHPDCSPELTVEFTRIKSVISTQSVLIRHQIHHQLFVEDQLEGLAKKHNLPV